MLIDTELRMGRRDGMARPTPRRNPARLDERLFYRQICAARRSESE
jgi:hypothetical protein